MLKSIVVYELLKGGGRCIANPEITKYLRYCAHNISRTYEAAPPTDADNQPRCMLVLLRC